MEGYRLGYLAARQDIVKVTGKLQSQQLRLTRLSQCKVFKVPTKDHILRIQRGSTCRDSCTEVRYEFLSR